MRKLFSLLFMGVSFVASAQEKKRAFGLATSVGFNSYALVDQRYKSNDTYGRLGSSAGSTMTIAPSNKFSIRGGHVGIVVEPQCRFYLTKVHDDRLEDNPIYLGAEIALIKL